MLTVYRDQVKEGCILAADVMAVTPQPLIPQHTVLTEQHLEVLKAFLVSQVTVEEMMIDGSTFQPETNISPPEDETPEKVELNPNASFKKDYLTAVQTYKEWFKKWQEGANVNITAVRNTMLPLIEKVLERPQKALHLYHYSTRDEYIFHHAVATGLLASVLAKKMNREWKECLQVGIAGALCDCGMSQIPFQIFVKREAMTKTEYEEMKNHPYHSYRMVKKSGQVGNEVLVGILQHHEREDGSGYPLAVNHQKIHMYSRILAVADVFHAISSERRHRHKQSPYKALDILARDEFGKFYPPAVQALTDYLLTYSIGTSVLLTNGEKAEVMYIDPKDPTRPTVQLEDSKLITQLTGKDNVYIAGIFAD
ncbi:HD-GYP domain-containing protein [Salsuginibacillus kocurii]|uniref:HD-GYP domain-containing protein n=1 Tax=Salsuginibacillus kocurii TaxID=427078 RepID=UPI000373A29B|nr:HD-GYP domain-containing protein [Salsuginibacillus kocurii]